MRKSLLAALVLLIATTFVCQAKQLAARQVYSLDGAWELALDPRQEGVQGKWWLNFPFKQAHKVEVPSCWESYSFAWNYDGVGWYHKRFKAPAAFAGKRVRLVVKSVNWWAEYWLNGHKIGKSDAGYIPFAFDVTKYLNYGGPNELVARVLDPGKTPLGPESEGLVLPKLPHAKEDWYVNYGGLDGDVELVATGEVYLEHLFVNADDQGKCSVKVLLTGQEKAEPVTLHFGVFSPESKSPVSTLTQKVTLAQAQQTFTFDLQVTKPHLWSLDDPYCYKLQVQVREAKSATLSDEYSTTFGFRSFTYSEGSFRLNGKPVLLKGALYQPYYPGSFSRPPKAGWCKREIAQAKAAGFNFFRLHVRIAPVELLQAADEQGFLLMEEPALGWVYDDNLERLKRRAFQQIKGMIERDYNHPSIVIWGMLNETSGDAKKFKREAVLYARSLDPTRLVTDDSGGWSGGSLYCLPFSTTLTPYEDIHPYKDYPTRQAVEDLLALKPVEPEGPLFVSEYGFGGLTNFQADLSGFGGRTWLDDYKRYKEFYEGAKRTFAENDLKAVFGSVQGMVEAAQRVQAAAARDETDALRANPGVSGYCYTQWQDAHWESSAGLVDVWGKPKAALKTFKRLNQPLRLLLFFSKPTCRVGEPVDWHVKVSNTNQSGGPVELEITLFSPKHKVLESTVRSLFLEPGKRVAELASGKVTHTLAPGVEVLKLRLLQQGKVLAETERKLFVAARPTVPGARILVLDYGSGLLQALRQAGYNAVPFADIDDVQGAKLAIIGKLPDLMENEAAFTRLARLRLLAENGGVVFCYGDLPPQPALQPLDLPQRGIMPARGHFMGCFHYVREHPLMAGLPAGDFMDSLWQDFRTARTLVNVSGLKVIGTVKAHGRVVGGELILHPVGKGYFLFSTLNLPLPKAAGPMAGLFWHNLVQWTSTLAVSPITVDQEAHEVRLRQVKLRKLQRRYVPVSMIGPFAAKPDGSGFSYAYPPEKERDFKASYLGVKGPCAWRQAKVLQGFAFDLSRYFPYENVECYVVTYLHSDRDQSARIKLGSDDSVKVFLNGKLVFSHKINRRCVPGEESFGIDLQKGENELLFKVENAGDGYGLAFEVVDEHGETFPGSAFSATPAGD